MTPASELSADTPVAPAGRASMPWSTSPWRWNTRGRTTAAQADALYRPVLSSLGASVVRIDATDENAIGLTTRKRWLLSDGRLLTVRVESFQCEPRYAFAVSPAKAV